MRWISTLQHSFFLNDINSNFYKIIAGITIFIFKISQVQIILFKIHFPVNKPYNNMRGKKSGTKFDFFPQFKSFPQFKNILDILIFRVQFNVLIN